MAKVSLPGGGWRYRDYQRPAWDYCVTNDGKRCVLPWHRRGGKDKFSLNVTAVKSHRRTGVYWHMLPEASQARKAIWDAVDELTGERLIDQAFPKAIRKDTRESDMFIRFHCGSTWQVVGSDNYQSLLGAPPIGTVFSEYAYANPAAWQKISPILLNNDGWALFVSSTFGRNHFHGLNEFALQEMAAGRDWFTQLLTVEDTGALVYARIEMARQLHRDFVWAGRTITSIKELSRDEIVAITREIILGEERQLAAQRGLEEARSIIQQEYYCSWDAAIPGAYYGAVIEGMERMTPSRVCAVPYDPGFAVETWWDLGISDDTAIWFVQKVGREYRVIDYYESSGNGLDHYANVMREKGYAYAPSPCVLPHDAAHGQLSQRGGASLAEVLKRQYGYGYRVVPQTRSLEYSINQVRSFLPTCVFDAVKCRNGLEKLRMYRRKWNETTRSFHLTPLHDYCSHAADAFRTGVEGLTSALPLVNPGVSYDLDTRFVATGNSLLGLGSGHRFAQGAEDDPLGRR